MKKVRSRENYKKKETQAKEGEGQEEIKGRSIPQSGKAVNSFTKKKALYDTQAHEY